MDKLDIRKVAHSRNAVLNVEGTYSPEKLGFNQNDVDNQLVEDVVCSWRFKTNSVGLWVQGVLSTSMAVPHRSTEAIPIDLKISEKFVFDHVVDDDSLAGERQLTDGDFFETVDENGYLDLIDLVRQYVIMEEETISRFGVMMPTTDGNQDDTSHSALVEG